MSITVRATTADDLAVMAALRRAWTEEDARGPVDDDGFDERFADWIGDVGGERRAWLAFADGTPVGMLNLAIFHRMPRPGRPDTRWGYVANVFVLAAWRSRGVGANLLEAAVAFARDEGFIRLVLNPSERSVPFYLRAGFEPAHRLMMLDLG